MTPKEKAKELVDDFFKHIQYAAYPYPSKAVVSAKNCAMLTVCEIIKIVSLYNDTQHEVQYWKEVKLEIEKL